MTDLIRPHGGLTEPVSCTVPADRVAGFRTEAARLPRVPVSDADLSTVYRFGDGALSPLTGPMDAETFHRVLDEAYITREGKRYAWTIPLSFPITESLAGRISRGDKVALENSQGEVVATLEVSDVFPWDKPKYLRSVYQTERTDHPGADMVLNGDGDRTHLLGGRIEVLPQPKHPSFGRYVLTPREVRRLLAEKGWKRVVAFQTRNPLHRAHEYALVYGAETLTREGKYAGVALNPLVGQLKGDDVNAEMRMKTYVNLVKHRLLGKGDSDTALWEKVGYDINDVFHLIGLDMRMLYGGPSEAVMHAIYRQNSGFSHIVIGRKHADAPYDDKTPIWGDFDAQEIFSNLPGELHTKPVNVGFAAFYESINRVDLTENHKDEKPFAISGTGVRDALVAGQRPDPRIMRPETADTLIEAYKK
jgi:sulfate adenylyltransferase